MMTVDYIQTIYAQSQIGAAEKAETEIVVAPPPAPHGDKPTIHDSEQATLLAAERETARR